MIKIINAFLVIAVLFSAANLYRLEHETRALERDVARIESEIEQRKEDSKLLRAEWASLTRPQRIQKLAQDRLGLRAITAEQIVPFGELAAKVAVSSLPGTSGDSKDGESLPGATDEQ